MGISTAFVYSTSSSIMTYYNVCSSLSLRMVGACLHIPASPFHSHNYYIPILLGKSLLWVAALGVVVLYIYAVVSFAFLHESFQAPDNDDATLFCSTLYECFASTIRYGLIENLGLVLTIITDLSVEFLMEFL